MQNTNQSIFRTKTLFIRKFFSHIHKNMRMRTLSKTAQCVVYLKYSTVYSGTVSSANQTETEIGCRLTSCANKWMLCSLSKRLTVSPSRSHVFFINTEQNTQLLSQYHSFCAHISKSCSRDLRIVFFSFDRISNRIDRIPRKP